MDFNDSVEAIDFDELISQSLMIKDNLLIQMEECRVEFKNSSKEFIISFFNQNAVKIITDNIELSNNVGSEGLQLLKNDITNLINNIDPVIENKFNVSALWWHLEENDYSYFAETSLPYHLDKEFRYIFGMLGEIMSSQGYIVTKPTTMPIGYNTEDDIVWAELEDGLLWVPIYLGEIQYNKELLSIISKYNSLLEEAKSRITEIDRLHLEKEKEEIKNLWSSL
ncbi:hypothetical protein [Metabacillus arenae]|uniref:Uncharacterized protein n=1 Tax=Metabacillus arenae TaxID=2771434 RepID=A0A926N888_9BACI|nr:hypothetical protein [Metabacillus arenae]MBD1379237.1 hypothetical protein [Metabacillus arenae]